MKHQTQPMEFWAVVLNGNQDAPLFARGTRDRVVEWAERRFGHSYQVTVYRSSSAEARACCAAVEYQTTLMPDAQEVK